jgi:hypothetical protein
MHHAIGNTIAAPLLQKNYPAFTLWIRSAALIYSWSLFFVPYLFFYPRCSALPQLEAPTEFPMHVHKH